MGAVYGNAMVVIAAHGYNFGFLRETLIELDDPWRPDDPPVFCRLRTDHRNFFITPTKTDSWFARGWCMQERLLARRILHFGGPSDEIWFECNSELNCECERANESRDVLHQQTLKELRASLLPTMSSMTDSAVDRDKIWRYYIRICEDYTARSLTFPKDALPAVSSLMSELAPSLGNYYAGIWQYNVLTHFAVGRHRTPENAFVHKNTLHRRFRGRPRSGAVIWYLGSDNIPTEETHTFCGVGGDRMHPF